MVNGNYVLYGDRPSSESEIVDDHVQTRTAERKNHKKSLRNGNDHQCSVNGQLDNETDSVKYEKKIKEPRLLRYIPTTEVQENFVTEKFETYDMKPSEERPRRYAFTKKPKNSSDGSVNYAYSRSNSNSPNSNLPTIAEHGEQYGTYRVRGLPMTQENDVSLPPYESKLDKYFVKPRETKKFKPKISYNGSHPDSLYRVPHSSGAEGGKMSRVVRALRWPAALLVVCASLAIFVYFLMPDHMDSGTEMLNSTFWESPGMNRLPQASESSTKLPAKQTTTSKPGSTKKPVEIDFYDADNEKSFDLVSIIDFMSDKTKRKLPIPPVFPSHVKPEVQYGNEEAEDKQRTPKAFDDINKLPEESTLKPHITQKPEKPLAIYFNDATPASLNPETIHRAETVNDFNPYEKAKPAEQPKRYTEAYKRYPAQPKRPITQYKVKEDSERVLPELPPEIQEYYTQQGANVNTKFTSGHSKFFGVGIEDIEKMQSTTQSSVYNTRVSPTLPTWRDGDDSTTKKYPVNLNIDVPQCRSPQLALCRGVLPYDLAGPAPTIAGSDISSFLTEMEYVVSTNCSERARQFVCSLLEPECNPPPFPPKKPCYSLCKAVMDSCESYIPHSMAPAFNCKQYDDENCMKARTPCYRREMACGDGTCVPRDWVCDGKKDCPAGDDEMLCRACDSTQFQCPSGGCVQKRWICDGYLDCPEGEDEQVETCAKYGLSPAAPSTEGAAGEGVEPGEEGAGSAPAPAVHRPNTIPGREGRQRSNARTAIEDSSKELLVMSDSSNALSRNFSRYRPVSRLTPYRPTVPLPTTFNQEELNDDENPVQPLVKLEKPKRVRNKITTVKPQTETQKESTEDFEPLGFMGDIEKDLAREPKAKKNEEQNSYDIASPTEVPTEHVKETKMRTFNTSSSKFDRIIDGASLLRKAAAEEEKERAMLTQSQERQFEDEEREREKLMQAGRSSPCPSGELRCVDGLCISLSQLCDGTIDCSDHADEDNCFT